MTILCSETSKQGELISGAADAQTAAQFTEQVQAAEATPSTQATVQGQLASLTANFDAANPPAWAAGAMRNATAQMAAAWTWCISLAGQAIVQATMEVCTSYRTGRCCYRCTV